MLLEKLKKELIMDEADVLIMLDELLEKRDHEWWDKFYLNRDKPIPFFVNVPDENLVSLVESGKLKTGRVLDIGCGNGRNSVYLAKKGFCIDGIDFSTSSIEWARELASKENVEVNFINGSFFDSNFEQNTYDFIYDGGCLHHIKPHRRDQYLRKISEILKKDGYFGLTCFNLKGGANISDYDVYRDFSMKGGLGFSEDKLKAVLEQHFTICEIREMKEITDGSLFGKEFLWTVIAKKK